MNVRDFIAAPQTSAAGDMDIRMARGAGLVIASLASALLWVAIAGIVVAF